MVITVSKNQVANVPTDIQSQIERTQRLGETAPPVTTNPDRMGGTPVIGIERLPVEYLIGYLMKGGTVEEFADEFDVDRDKVLAALGRIREALADGWLAERVDY
ncbi:MAG: DUF433 domain-containing protein [Blastocatellia bacterium]